MLTPPHSSTRNTVLVIDDEEEIRTLLRLVLEGEGYDVLTASGGREGLSLLSREMVDLVLVDGHMPQGSGTEVIQRMQATRQWADIPVFLVSALEPDDGLDVAWVRKPFSVDELVERIALALENVDRSSLVVTRKSGT